MKKLATALSIGAFSLVFSQGVNISKFHRAYIAQDENNVAFLVKAPDDEPSKMQAKIKAIKAKEDVAPYSQVPLLPGTERPSFGQSKQDFIDAVNAKIDKNAVTGSGTQYTHVSFLVTETGKISDVKASGNNESLNLATILAIYDLNQGFVPAKYKGKNMASVVHMNIPVEL